MELTQIRLIVTDFGGMFRFYRDVLGLHPQVDDERGPYGKLSLPSGSTAIALQERQHLEASLGRLGDPGAIRAVIAIRVSDIESLCERLRARGGTFLKPMDGSWGNMRVAHLVDPEGNVIELQQWGA